MTILAAVGGEYEQDQVIKVAFDLAKVYNDDLVAIHVMEDEKFDEISNSSNIDLPVMVPGVEEFSGPSYVTSDRSISEYNLEDATADAAAVAERCVKSTIPDQDTANVNTSGRVGDPTTEIVAEADRIDARYIVVGGRKRSPTGKAIFGSVAQSVILNTSRPVVAITQE